VLGCCEGRLWWVGRWKAESTVDEIEVTLAQRSCLADSGLPPNCSALLGFVFPCVIGLVGLGTKEHYLLMCGSTGSTSSAEVP